MAGCLGNSYSDFFVAHLRLVVWMIVGGIDRIDTSIFVGCCTLSLFVRRRQLTLPYSGGHAGGLSLLSSFCFSAHTQVTIITSYTARRSTSWNHRQLRRSRKTLLVWNKGGRGGRSDVVYLLASYRLGWASWSTCTAASAAMNTVDVSTVAVNVV